MANKKGEQIEWALRPNGRGENTSWKRIPEVESMMLERKTLHGSRGGLSA